MTTFAHGSFDFWRNQSNQKALTPAIGASANFSPTQNFLSDSNKKLYIRTATLFGSYAEKTYLCAVAVYYANRPIERTNISHIQ